MWLLQIFLRIICLLSKRGKGKSTSLFVQEKFVAVSNITASSQQSERGNK